MLETFTHNLIYKQYVCIYFVQKCKRTGNEAISRRHSINMELGKGHCLFGLVVIIHKLHKYDS